MKIEFPKYVVSFTSPHAPSDLIKKTWENIANSDNKFKIVTAGYSGTQKIVLDMNTGSPVFRDSSLPVINIDIQYVHTFLAV